MVYGSHLNFSERCSNNIIEQTLSCLHNLIGVGGFAAEAFSQTILPSNMFWSTVVFSGLLETCQGSAEPYVCRGMTWSKAVWIYCLPYSLIVIVSSLMMQWLISLFAWTQQAMFLKLFLWFLMRADTWFSNAHVLSSWHRFWKVLSSKTHFNFILIAISSLLAWLATLEHYKT